MDIKTKITLTEKDLKYIIAKQFDLDESTITLIINKYEGDAREASYTYIIVEGKSKTK